MTLSVSQGKLLLKCSHPDQYTMQFFFLAKSNYTTETSKSILSQANLKLAIEDKGMVYQLSQRSTLLNTNKACISVLLKKKEKFISRTEE
jgi:hypothetical protein